MIELTIRIIFSLLIVFALMWGMAKLAKRPLGIRRGGLIDVLGRQQLSRGASVAVVRVADKAMVLGVTDGQVTLLSEADLEAIAEYEAQPHVHREPVPLDSLEAEGAAPPQRTPARTGHGPLAGSALSAHTWAQTWQFLRDRMVRKS